MDKILINGAGLGGLALACCISEIQRKQGIKRFELVITERDASITERPQGYSLRLQHNGFRTLQFIGLYDRMKAESSPTLYFVTLGADGEVIKLVSKKDDLIPTFNLPRERVRQLLYECATEKYGVPVLWGKQMTHFEQSSTKVQAHFADGESLDAAYMVGCDGTRSLIKEQLLGTDGLGYLGVASMVGVGRSEANFTKNTNLQILDGTTRVFCKPFDKDSLMWQMTWRSDLAAVAKLAAASQDSKLSPTVNEALFEQARHLTKKWTTPIIPDLLSSTVPSQVKLIPLYDSYENVKTWKTGRVTLLGDSAHTMSPFKGQGANNALQDALELAEMLADATEISSALEAYETKMRARSKAHVYASRNAVRIYHTPEGLLPENIGDEL
jgi:salicylate hydroxylase